jgi:hypothetical protein
LKGEIPEDKRISDKLIITEYWRNYLILDEKEKEK